VNVCYRKKGIFTIADSWFNSSRDYKIEQYCDFIQYHDLHEPLQEKQDLVKERISCTLITDLQESDEGIMEHFRGSVRNEIRRAKKEGIFSEVYCSKQLCEDTTLMLDFEHHLADMYANKSIKARRVHNSLTAYAKSGMLAISIAKQKNALYVYHVYIIDGKVARLLHSVSLFRESKNVTMRNRVGWANRMLHYQDMLYFKGIQYEVYDWGGYSINKELKNINEFKAGFGGELIKTYHYVFACSHFGKGLAFGLRIKDRLRNLSFL